MADNEQTFSFGNGSVPKTVDPDTSFSGDTALVESLQQSLPSYQGINPYHLKSRLLQDDEFYNKFTTDFFKVTETEQLSQLRQEDPESYEALNTNFRKNLRNKLTKSSYAGETEKDTLVDRTLSLRSKATDLPIDAYKDIVSGNAKNYEKYELFSGGEFIYSDDRDDRITFAQKVANNPELHEQIIRDRYKEFQKALTTSHNNPAVLSDSAKKTQAWVIYDNFGSEGLTQYINALQKDDPKVDIAAQYSGREEAKEFFSQARIGDKTPQDLVKDFVVGSAVKDTPYSDLINQSSEYNVSPALMAGMIRQESGFNPNAVSDSGAVGLLQYMPAAGREAGLKVPDELYELDVARMEAKGAKRRELTQQLAERTKELSTPETDDRLDPEKAIVTGAKQLGKRLERYDFDPEKAVASWNAGMGRVDRAVEDSSATGKSWKQFIPQNETAPHITKVMQYANQYGAPTPLVFKPAQARDDITKEVPSDLNPFTEHFYGLNSAGDGLEDKDPTDVSIDFLKRYAPDDYQKFLDTSNLRASGEFSDEYGQLTWGVYEWANNTDNLTALMDTVKDYGEAKDVDGEPVFRVNYGSAPPKVRVAIDALRYDNEGNYMLQYVTDGVYDFRPKRRETAQQNVEWMRNLVYNTTTELYRDEEGTIQRRTVPQKGGLAGIWNTVATVGLGGADMINRFFYEPAVRTAGELTGHAGTKAYADALRDWTGVDLAEGLTAETDGIVPNAVGEVAPFLEYMGAMMVGGSALIRGGAKAFGALANAKKAYDVQRYATNLAGSSRWQAIAQKLNYAVKNKSPWATSSLTKRSPWVTGAGVFYTGGAAIEATQPTDVSFMTTVPQLLGYEPTNDVTELYKTSSRAGQRAMDIGASLVMDGFFDTMIAGTKFLGGKAGQKYFGRKEFKGIKYRGAGYDNQKFGGYEVVDQPQFRHDLVEFWTNLTSDLDKLPIGNVGETMARGFTKGQKFGSLHDFTRAFIDDSEFVAGNVRRDIEDNIRFLNRTLGDGIELEPAQIDDLVSEQYGHFIESLSDQMYGTLRTSSEDLPLRFAQTLGEQIPNVKRFAPDGEPIRPNQMVDYPDRDLIRKGDEVYEVDSQFWTIDLANSIRQRALRDTQSDVLARKKNKLPEGYSSDEYEQLRSQVEQTIGTPVNINGKTGYVVDFDDAGYTIRTSDGDIQKAQVITKLDDEFVTEQHRQVIERLNKQGTEAEFISRPSQEVIDEVDAGYRNALDQEYLNKYSQRLKDTADTIGKVVNRQLDLPFC